MKQFTLIPILLLMLSCSKSNHTVAPAATSLRFTITDENGAAVNNAYLALYKNAADYTANLPAHSAYTDASGKAVFYNVDPIRYFYKASLGCKNSVNYGNQIAYPLSPASSNTASAIIQSTGSLKFVNNSNNPYRVYVNGVEMVGSLNGNTTYYLYNMPARAYTIRVLQLSGYLVSPTDQTYTGTLTCGGMLTTTFP
jgi:hypothetical protein